MSNAETLNQYIKELFDYWNGKNDDFDALFCSFGEHIDDVTAVKLAVCNAHGGHSGGNSDVS